MKDAIRSLFLKLNNFSLYRNYKNKRWSDEVKELPSLVFYDHACPLCRAEMQRLKSLDQHNRLRLVDISADRFDETKWGIPRARMSEALHVFILPGQWLVGMPAIRHVYRQVGWGFLVAPTAWPIVSPLADVFYRYFAPNRNRVSRWLGFRASAAGCANGACASTQQRKDGGAA